MEDNCSRTPRSTIQRHSVLQPAAGKDTWVVNLSDMLLTPELLSVLEKGLNFTPTHSKDITKMLLSPSKVYFAQTSIT